MPDLAYFALAERTLFWLNALLTGHGPEAVASRLEKYRTAHHCEVAVEAEEGISLEWLKEDYEIAKVECFSRDQKEPGKVQLSYSNKPGNFGGLLEGAIVLQLLVEPPAKKCVCDSSSAQSVELQEDVLLPMIETGLSAMEAPLDSVAQHCEEALPESNRPPQTIDVVVETPSEHPPASKTLQGVSTESAVAHLPAPAPSPRVVQPVKEAPPLLRAVSASELWRRWCPLRRRPPAPSGNKATPPPAAPLPAPATSALPLGTATASGAAKVADELGGNSLKASRPPCSLTAHDKASLLPATQAVGAPEHAEATASAPGAANNEPQSLHVAVTGAAKAAVSEHAPAEAKPLPKSGFCVIYFSVDPLTGGNRFGVSCMDDAQNTELQPASGNAAAGDTPWWTACTRRKVERNPSKLASWRTAALGSDAQLNASHAVFGANERMPLRREDVVGISVSAEMTSCLDATLKVKLKLAEPLLTTKVAMPSSLQLQRPNDASPLPVHIDSGPMELAQQTAVTDDILPLSRADPAEGHSDPGNASFSQGSLAVAAPPPLCTQVVEPKLPLSAQEEATEQVAAEEVILDVKPSTDSKAQETPPASGAPLWRPWWWGGVDAVASSEELQPIDEGTDPASATVDEPGEGATEAASKGIGHAQSAPWWDNALPHPWEALRSPSQQPTNFMVWHAAPPARAAIADTERTEVVEVVPLGAALLAIASAAPAMEPIANESTEVHTGSPAPIVIPERVVTAPTCGSKAPIFTAAW